MSVSLMCQCTTCGKLFKGRRSQVARVTGKYCSHKCAALASPNDSWEICPGVICVKLNRDVYALVDTVDYPKISAHRWHARKTPTTFYAARDAPCGELPKTIFMHRVLLSAPDGMFVDHINGNGLDNSSISGSLNIRLVTNRQNSQNYHSMRASKFPGVSRVRKTRWESRIQINGKCVHLGFFGSEIDAAKAYTDACLRNGFVILGATDISYP